MSITTQPASQAIKIGVTLALGVAWNGSSSGFQWFKDGNPLSSGGDWFISGSQQSHPFPHGFSTLTKSNFNSSDAGNYYVVVTGVDTSDIAVITINSPILDRIEKAMESLVSGMTVSGGYNFNWGMVNEQDESMPDSSGNVNFPRCIIDPTDSLADKETNQDSLAGIGSGDYTNEVIFTLLVKGELPAFDANPLFAARSVLRQALDDLKKLFGTNRDLQGNCDNIMYSGSQIESLVRNDVQRPAQLRTFWKVVYSQDRIIPISYAGS
jgi:hypothetical protein